MQKTFLTICAIGSLIIGLQAFHANQQPKYKNLQILPENISKQGLDSIMNHFSNSLSVKCSFCHVRNEDTRKMDFASDAKKEKHITRGMMKMAIDINKEYFAIYDESAKNPDGTMKDTVSAGYMLRYVTCYTCHHGNALPISQPPQDDDDID